ncbi:hypothetical protein [Engelhardtia mirabilis]|uniref:Outer membrane biogenesis protein BamB n=1 Tax=Engelhardtia mirabilis TaxID=2528011 RepID=A0A518BMR4_9BACT|nr:hypothetical protein Pla133_33210 [Planctomycetes bacterium Pla133]QDV02552.1 hypothetical protein Pla86_33200 [Planctomycetes bacterium Pla86]
MSGFFAALALAQPAAVAAPAAVIARTAAIGPQGAGTAPTIDLLAGEGPLRNQCFVPVDEAAAERFLEGDRAWAEERVADALDAWRLAVGESQVGAVVPWIADLDAATTEASQPRAFDGVEEALLARLELSPIAAAAWRERFDEASDLDLRAALIDSALAGVERRWPGTSGGLRAALALGDRALERGYPVEARTWYDRAARHARLREEQASATAVERRRTALDGLQPAELVAPRYGGFGTGRQVALVDEVGPPPPFPSQPLGAGMRAGMVACGEDLVAVQTASRVHLVDLARGEAIETIEPAELIAEVLGVPPQAYSAEDPPGWPLQPATDGEALLVVAGRATPSRGRGNALVLIEPTSGRGGGPALARARWAVVDERWSGPDGVGSPALLAELDNVEFQPGPALVGRSALAQTRRGSGEIEAHLVALDSVTGEPRWRLLLAKGGELVPDIGRFAGATGRRGSGSPLTVCGPQVFVGTQLGLGSLVDAVDGRVRWSVLNRRKPSEDRGWTGSRAAWDPDSGLLAWAPADGDYLYWLAVGGLPRGPEGPFVEAPAPIGSGLSLQGLVAGPTGPVALILARAGNRTALAAWEARSGARREALHLLPGEPLREGLAEDGARVLVSSDRALYLFDRTRELLLLDRATLHPPGVTPAGRWAGGGAVLRIGNRAVVAGHDHLELFELR